MLPFAKRALVRDRYHARSDVEARLDRSWQNAAPRRAGSALMFDATYVINLDRSTDRWAAMQITLGAMGIHDAIRWSATEPGELPGWFEELRERGLLARETFRFNEPARRFEVACALSHQAVLREIIRTGARTALILEDDIALAGDPATWPERCRTAFADLPPSWGVWYLYRCLDIESRVTRLTPRTVRPWMPLGGAAYAVTSDGARRLLGTIDPVRTPVDWAYAAMGVRRGRVEAYAASPRLILPGAAPSIIREQVHDDRWVVDGVTVPPEYWPAVLLPGLSRASLGEFGPFPDLVTRVKILRRHVRRRLHCRPLAPDA
jgi:GR25 family glycosyltransferase involved in LPS biosynthesis